MNLSLQKREKLAGILSPVAIFFVLLLSSGWIALVNEYVSRGSRPDLIDYLEATPEQFLLSVGVVFLVSVFVAVITSRTDVSVTVCAVLFTVFATINYFKTSYRHEPVFPWDIYLVGDAANILPKISLSIPNAMILSYISVILLIAAIFLLCRKRRFRFHFKNKIQRFSSVAAVLVALTVFGHYSFFDSKVLSVRGVGIDQWDQLYGYKMNGLIPSFLMNFKFFKVNKPAGYNKTAVEDILNQYENTITTPKMMSSASGTVSKVSATTPNIIVIMSESFIDLEKATNLSFNRRLHPNIDYLRKNFYCGSMVTPMFGGGTANVEFEALTSYSYMGLTPGATPYAQYIRKDTNNITSFLSSAGYNTVAIHTNNKTNWNRVSVYKKFGFDYFVSEEDFTNPQRERTFITDSELTQRIIKEYESSKSSGKPFFNFSVSMLNHGGYLADQFSKDEQVKITAKNGSVDSSLLGQFTTYATGLYKSDQALGDLINYFKKVDEPTMIVFFGDHAGGGFLDGYNAYQKIGYLTDSSNAALLAEQLYTTPFVTWNNFDKAGASADTVAAFQLLPSVFAKLGVVHPKYYNYMLDTTGYFRGYVNGQYFGIDGKAVTRLPGDAMQQLTNYNILGYDLFAGKGYASAELWSK